MSRRLIQAKEPSQGSVRPRFMGRIHPKTQKSVLTQSRRDAGG